MVRSQPTPSPIYVAVDLRGLPVEGGAYGEEVEGSQFQRRHSSVGGGGGGPRETRRPSRLATPVSRDFTMLQQVERSRSRRKHRKLEHKYKPDILSPQDRKRNVDLIESHLEALKSQYCLVGRAAEDKIKEMKQSPTEITIYVVGGRQSDILAPHRRKRGQPQCIIDKKRQERYRGVDVVIVCAPIYEHELLKVQTDWIPEISSSSRPGIPFIIAGTKADLRPDNPGRHSGENILEEEGFMEESIGESFSEEGQQNLVDFESAERFALDIGAKAYLECAPAVGDSGANGVNAVLHAAVGAVEVFRECDVCKCSIM